MKVYNNEEDQEKRGKTRDDKHLVRACELYMLGKTYGDCGGRYPRNKDQDESWKEGKTRQDWVPFTDSLDIKTLIDQEFVE